MNKLKFLPLLLFAVMSSCDEDVNEKYSERQRVEKNLPEKIAVAPENEITTKSDKNGFQLSFQNQVSYGNLTLIPITANAEFFHYFKGTGNYKTLKEGVESKAIIVSEHGDGQTSRQLNSNRYQEEQRRNYQHENARGLNNSTFLSNTSTTFASAQARNNRSANNYSSPTVNSLSIENTGDDTVIVLAGELVKGGDQDRVVAEDLLVMPHSGKIPIPVFCVEANRWTHEGFYGNSIKFGFTNNFASSSIRKIITQDKDQSAVWNRVGEVTKINAAGSSTNSYNALENSSEFTSKRKNYLTAVEQAFTALRGVVGVLVTDKQGRVLACDIFTNTELFSKEFKGLIHGYITEAISAEKGLSGLQKGTPTAKAYFDAVKSEFTTSEKKKENHLLIHQGKIIHYSRF